MDIDALVKELAVIRSRLASHNVLDDIGLKALDEGIATLNASTRAKLASKARRAHQWELPINEGLPLLFRETPKGTRILPGLVADIHGRVARPGATGVSDKVHSLTIRFWCRDAQVAFRPLWDSRHVEKELTTHGKRVLLRFRLERGVAGSREPHFHMQLGGTARGPRELCWYPDKLDMPRFLHFPVALITAVELVLMALYPDTFDAVVKEPEWRTASLCAQEHFMRPYFREAAGCFFEGLGLNRRPRHFLEHMLTVGRSGS